MLLTLYNTRYIIKEKTKHTEREMNEYHNLLINEFGKTYADSMIKWARSIIKASSSEYPTSKQFELMRDWDSKCDWYNNDAFYPYALAVMSLMKKRYSKQITVNSDEILGKAFSIKMFRCLQEKGLIDIFMVAQPYQIVFLV